VLDAYKNTYEDHKERLKSYFPEGTEPRLWEFAPKLVFARYDKFVERVKTVRVGGKFKSCPTEKLKVFVYMYIPSRAFFFMM
jgi:hypothetical protein